MMRQNATFSAGRGARHRISRNNESSMRNFNIKLIGSVFTVRTNNIKVRIVKTKCRNCTAFSCISL